MRWVDQKIKYLPMETIGFPKRKASRVWSACHSFAIALPAASWHGADVFPSKSQQHTQMGDSISVNSKPNFWWQITSYLWWNSGWFIRMDLTLCTFILCIHRFPGSEALRLREKTQDSKPVKQRDPHGKSTYPLRWATAKMKWNAVCSFVTKGRLHFTGGWPFFHDTFCLLDQVSPSFLQVLRLFLTRTYIFGGISLSHKYQSLRISKYLKAYLLLQSCLWVPQSFWSKANCWSGFLAFFEGQMSSHSSEPSLLTKGNDRQYQQLPPRCDVRHPGSHHWWSLATWVQYMASRPATWQPLVLATLIWSFIDHAHANRSCSTHHLLNVLMW